MVNFNHRYSYLLLATWIAANDVIEDTTDDTIDAIATMENTIDAIATMEDTIGDIEDTIDGIGSIEDTRWLWYN